MIGNNEIKENALVNFSTRTTRITFFLYMFVKDINFRYTRKDRTSEVKDSMTNMRIRKAFHSDSISIEVWKCLADVGVE